MDYVVKVKDEQVEVIMPAGKDFVKTLYGESKARATLAAAKTVEKSDLFDGFLCVDEGKIFIAGKIATEKKEPTKKATSKKK